VAGEGLEVELEVLEAVLMGAGEGEGVAVSVEGFVRLPALALSMVKVPSAGEEASTGAGPGVHAPRPSMAHIIKTVTHRKLTKNPQALQVAPSLPENNLLRMEVLVSCSCHSIGSVKKPPFSLFGCVLYNWPYGCANISRQTFHLPTPA
jgi:hypothetical protein